MPAVPNVLVTSIIEEYYAQVDCVVLKGLGPGTPDDIFAYKV